MCPGCREREARIAALDARIAALEMENAALRARLGELESGLRETQARLRQNSSNSSRPPSSDPPGTPRPHKPPSGRKPGGQPGHSGKSRSLRPPEEVDERQDIFPSECEHCQTPLPRDSRPPGSEPTRHQYVEIPPVVARLTEVRLHALVCPGCGHVTRAALPGEVPSTAVGPRLQAVGTYLAGQLHISDRGTQQALTDLFGPKANVSLGTVVQMQQRTSQALAPAYQEALEFAQAQEVKHSDETRWRVGTKCAWLWILVTSRVVVFRIDLSRSRAAFLRLVGKVHGILISDRYSAYRNWPREKWQVCWAHLKRDYQKLVDRGGSAAEIGQACLGVVRQVFEGWGRFRAGRIDRAQLQSELGPVQEELEAILAMGSEDEDPRAAGVCRELLGVYPALWTFTRQDGVPPTNNDAERPLRPAVLWRKGSYGSQSQRGGRFVERILTVVATLRRQGRNVLEYLEQTIRAQQLGARGPSLVPEEFRPATQAHAA